MKGSYMNNPCRSDEYDPPTPEEEYLDRVRASLHKAIDYGFTACGAGDECDADVDIRKVVQEMKRLGLIVNTIQEPRLPPEAPDDIWIVTDDGCPLESTYCNSKEEAESLIASCDWDEYEGPIRAVRYAPCTESN